MYKKSLPPGKITIGFDVRADTLYKIFSEKQVIQAGLFRKGFHAVDLRSSDFFRKTGTHRFELECKWGDSVIAKEITIDIRLLPLYIVQKASQSWKQRVYSLSFLIGDELVYSTRKFAPADISFKIDLPPWEARYNPFGLMDGIQKPPTATGIPILGAAVGLYYLVKTLSSPEKKTNEDIAPIKKQRIETTFLKTIESGDLWQWRAWVSIRAKDVETGKFPR